MNKTRIAVLAVAALAPLVVAASAAAHAVVTPPVALAKEGQLFTLSVPTEKDAATTTTVELTPPAGFAIDSFVAVPGWKRTVQQTGSGEDATITSVTWSGGTVPTGEDASFAFVADATSAGHYTFGVRQTYSDGTVVNWSGGDSSDTPAPVVDAVSSLGGEGTSTFSIVGVALAALALLVAGAGLLRGSGREIA
jgi:uncharacterized protein YcnI